MNKIQYGIVIFTVCMSKNRELYSDLYLATILVYLCSIDPGHCIILCFLCSVHCKYYYFISYLLTFRKTLLYCLSSLPLFASISMHYYCYCTSVLLIFDTVLILQILECMLLRSTHILRIRCWKSMVKVFATSRIKME